MQETLNSKKQGDAAFRAKDFTTAIDCYTQVSNLLRSLQDFSINLKFVRDAYVLYHEN